MPGMNEPGIRGKLWSWLCCLSCRNKLSVFQYHCLIVIKKILILFWNYQLSYQPGLRWKEKKALAGSKIHIYPNFCLQICVIWLLSFGPHCPHSIAWSFLSYGLCPGYFLSKILFSCLFSPMRLASHLINIPVSQRGLCRLPRLKLGFLVSVFSGIYFCFSLFRRRGVLYSVCGISVGLRHHGKPILHVGPEH